MADSNAEEILKLLFSYMPKIAEERKMDGLLILMADLGRSLVEADRCSLWIVDEKKGELWTKVAHGVDELRIPMNFGFVGYTLNSGESLCIQDAYQDPRFDSNSDLKTKYHTHSVLTVPLRNSEGHIIGVFQAINKKKAPYYFSLKDLDFFSLTAVYSAKTIESALLMKELEETQAEILCILGEVSEYRSKETSDHVMRVASACYKMALYYGLSEVEASQIRLAAPLHDLGKVGIPDSILQKPGRFTPEEYDVMKTHAEKGNHILKNSSRKLLKLAAEIAMGHHEHWDGSGYPRGLSGEDIPLSSRICAVVDVFDALSSTRCYKEPWPEEKIKEYFAQERNRQFQKELVDILLLHWDEFY